MTSRFLFYLCGIGVFTFESLCRFAYIFRNLRPFCHRTTHIAKTNSVLTFLRRIQLISFLLTGMNRQYNRYFNATGTIVRYLTLLIDLIWRGYVTSISILFNALMCGLTRQDNVVVPWKTVFVRMCLFPFFSLLWQVPITRHDYCMVSVTHSNFNIILIWSLDICAFTQVGLA